MRQNRALRVVVVTLIAGMLVAAVPDQAAGDALTPVVLFPG